MRWVKSTGKVSLQSHSHFSFVIPIDVFHRRSVDLSCSCGSYALSRRHNHHSSWSLSSWCLEWECVWLALSTHCLRRIFPTRRYKRSVTWTHPTHPWTLRQHWLRRLRLDLNVQHTTINDDLAFWPTALEHLSEITRSPLTSSALSFLLVPSFLFASRSLTALSLTSPSFSNQPRGFWPNRV